MYCCPLAARVGRGAVVALTCGALAALSGGAAPATSAQAPRLFDAGQERQAIFPVYDGFTRNDDGSLTLSFAYFSHNAAPVGIPVGASNAFSPGPADVGQPTTFWPGHHRWQCIMVVDPDFPADLRWTISYAGTTTATTDAMLQYNWEFAAADERNALRDIEDPTTQPRDVCLNRPPIVRVLGYGGRRGPTELPAITGQGLKLFGSVRDEGLPRGGGLRSRWEKVSGPGDVRFDASGSPRTLAFFDEPGDYVLRLAATDSERESTTEVNVVVRPAP